MTFALLIYAEMAQDQSTPKQEQSVKPPLNAPRLAYPDMMRGFAVVLMILWHSADAWLKPELQGGLYWQVMHFLAGLGAPIFFVMLGFGASLSSQRLRSLEECRFDGAARRLLTRGLEIVGFGYLLQLQLWTFDHSGLTKPWGPTIVCCLLAGYLLVIVALRRVGRMRSPPVGLFGWGLLCIAIGVYAATSLPADELWAIFRVDVLQTLGLSLITIALLRVIFPALSSFAGGIALAILTALVTYPIATSFSSTPSPFWSHYLVRLPHPLRLQRRARFPFFPWGSLAFGGMALACFCWRARGRLQVVKRAVVLALTVGLVTLLTWEGKETWQQTLYDIPAAVQPLRMVFRFSALCLLVALFYGFPRRWLNKIHPLGTLGRCSLMLYCFHLELVYGRVVWFLQGELTLGQWLVVMLGMQVLAWLIARGWIRHGRAVSCGIARLFITLPHIFRATSSKIFTERRNRSSAS